MDWLLENWWIMLIISLFTIIPIYFVIVIKVSRKWAVKRNKVYRAIIKILGEEKEEELNEKEK